ncbi:MAG: hypothetical protein ACLU7D_09100 [Collinsella sp.]
MLVFGAGGRFYGVHGQGDMRKKNGVPIHDGRGWLVVTGGKGLLDGHQGIVAIAGPGAGLDFTPGGCGQ